jgi:Na+/phosphate symporter
MDEKELREVFYSSLSDAEKILGAVEKGLFAENASPLKESKKKFVISMKPRLEQAEKVIAKKEKDKVEIKYLGLMVAFQAIALALENLIQKMEKKIESKTLFSEKAMREIKNLIESIKAMFRDTKDYIITGNPVLKENIKKGKEGIFGLAVEYEMIHQDRLVTGVCMPLASYFYIDMTDSIKRIASALADFAEKVQ